VDPASRRRSSATAKRSASARSASTRSGTLVVVLDAWAVLALYEGHPRAGEISSAIEGGGAIVSAVNLGEALYWLERDHGLKRATELVDGIRSTAYVEEPDWTLVASAAHIKAGGGLSYADAFCIATAQRHDAPLYTGDPEILALGELVEMVDLRETPES
jgi:PIN domain nuclease of toxin-antitoxin system